jgi:hypothetical protein
LRYPALIPPCNSLPGLSVTHWVMLVRVRPSPSPSFFFSCLVAMRLPVEQVPRDWGREGPRSPQSIQQPSCCYAIATRILSAHASPNPVPLRFSFSRPTIHSPRIRPSTALTQPQSRNAFVRLSNHEQKSPVEKWSQFGHDTENVPEGQMSTSEATWGSNPRRLMSDSLEHCPTQHR